MSNTQPAAQQIIEGLGTRQPETVTRLCAWRVHVEIEAEASLKDIPTFLDLALADICEVLGLEDEDIHFVLGDLNYRAVYSDPIPYSTPTPEDEARARAFTEHLKVVYGQCAVVPQLSGGEIKVGDTFVPVEPAND